MLNDSPQACPARRTEEESQLGELSSGFGVLSIACSLGLGFERCGVGEFLHAGTSAGSTGIVVMIGGSRVSGVSICVQTVLTPLRTAEAFRVPCHPTKVKQIRSSRL